MPIRRSIEALKRDLSAMRVKGSFARNALYTFGDAAVNVLAQIILTPIVAHIFGPAAYGIYGLFNSIANNLAVVGGLGYPAAIVMPKEDRQAVAIMRLNMLLLVAMLILSLPFFLFPSLLYTMAPSWSVMGDWCMLVPWMVFVLGMNQVLIAWAVRAKSFSTVAKVNASSNIAVRLLNLGLGLATKGATWGLVFSDVLIRTLSACWYFLSLRMHGIGKVMVRDDAFPLRAVALEYKEYPMYIFPGRWLSLFATQLPIFGLVSLGDKVVVGHFTLASALLLMPLRLFGYSLASVFFKKAADLTANDPQALGAFVLRMYVRLRAMGIVPFISLIFFGDLIFNWILGEEWAGAGAYCGIMGPFYLFRLLSEPIQTVYNAQREERALFGFNVALFIVNALAVGIGTWLLADPVAIVVLFSAVNTLAYLYQSADVLGRTGLPRWRITATTVLAALALSIALSALRFAIAGSWWPSLG